MTTLRAGGATDVGRVRSNNQDHLLVADPLFAVADGMGGHAGGEVASLTAVEELVDSFQQDRTAAGLAEAVRRANRAVWERARQDRDLRGMGTTLAAVALVEDDGEESIAIVNVGDSRVYLFRDNNLDQLTDDHSVPKELERAGRLSPEEAAIHPQHNVLTRALGIDQDVVVDTFDVVPYRGDRLLLASDGLFNEVEDSEIAGVLRRVQDPEEAARQLVGMARDNGGNDNITVVVVDVTDDDDRAARASAAVPTARYQAVGGGGARPTAKAGPEDDDGPRAGRPSAAVSSRPAPPPAPPAAPSLAPAPTAKSRRTTVRAVVFVALVLAVLATAAAAVGYYARGSYYVGLDGERVTVFKGRPGGLLWFQPTVEQRTGLWRDDIRPSYVADVEAGKEEPSLAEARRYVERIKKPPPEPPPAPPPDLPGEPDPAPVPALPRPLPPP